MPKDKPARRRRSFARTLGLFLLLNILPIGALAWIGFRWSRGEIELAELPSGFAENLIVLGAGVVLLIVVASFSLPAAHAVVRELGTYMAYRRAILAGSVSGSRLLSLLLLPLLAAAYVVAWPVRLALILAALLLVAGILVFLVRLFEPGFLEDWLEEARGYLER